MVPLFYFGPVSYWIDLVTHDNIAFDLNHPIPKKSYANRCIIATANGLQTLSIPIHGGRGTRQVYENIKISYAENWIGKHKMALKSAYSKSPFYAYYIDRYELVLSKNYQYLHELNLNLFSVTAGILKLSTSTEIVQSHTKTNLENFSPSTLNTVPEYPQVFRSKYDFQPDLCILDLVFNLGNQSHSYLLNSERQI